MSEYCIDHLSLIPMTIAELKTHIFERHQFDFDVGQICDYRCEYCDEAFICFSDAYSHKQKKGHEINKYGPQLEDELKEIMTKEFDGELERCKRAEPHVREELAELQRKKDSLRGSLPKPKNRYSFSNQKEELLTAPSTPSNGRSAPEADNIPFCERKIVKINVKSPFVREDKPVIKDIGGAAPALVEERAVEPAEDPEELDLEVEEEDEPESLLDGDEDSDYRAPPAAKRRRESPSPGPSKSKIGGAGNHIGERVVIRRRTAAQMMVADSRQNGEDLPRGRRARRPPSAFGEVVPSGTLSRSVSRERSPPSERHRTPVMESKRTGEETPSEASRTLRSRCRPPASPLTPSLEEKSRVAAIRRAASRPPETTGAEKREEIRRANTRPPTSTLEGSQPEKRGRGRPRKYKGPVFINNEDERLRGGSKAPPAVPSPRLSTLMMAPSPVQGPKATEAPPHAPEGEPAPVQEPEVPTPPSTAASTSSAPSRASPAVARAPSPAAIEESAVSSSVPSVEETRVTSSASSSTARRAPSPLPPAVLPLVAKPAPERDPAPQLLSPPPRASPRYREDRDDRRRHSRSPRRRSYGSYNRRDRSRSWERSRERNQPMPPRPFYSPVNGHYNYPPRPLMNYTPSYPLPAPEFPGSDHIYESPLHYPHASPQPYQAPQVMNQPPRSNRPSYPPSEHETWRAIPGAVHGREEQQFREVKTEVEEEPRGPRPSVRPGARPIPNPHHINYRHFGNVAPGQPPSHPPPPSR